MVSLFAAFLLLAGMFDTVELLEVKEHGKEPSLGEKISLNAHLIHSLVKPGQIHMDKDL